MKTIGITIALLGVVCMILPIILVVLTPSAANLDEFRVKISNDNPDRAYLFYGERWHFAEWIAVGNNATLFIDGNPKFVLLKSPITSDLSVIKWTASRTNITLYVDGYAVFQIVNAQ